MQAALVLLGLLVIGLIVCACLSYSDAERDAGSDDAEEQAFMGYVFSVAAVVCALLWLMLIVIHFQH